MGWGCLRGWSGSDRCFGLEVVARFGVVGVYGYGLVVCWWFGVGCFAVGFVLACLVWFLVYACDYWLRFDFGVNDVVVLVVFITIVAGLLLLVIWLGSICGLFVGWCLLHAMDVSGGGLFVWICGRLLSYLGLRVECVVGLDWLMVLWW